MTGFHDVRFPLRLALGASGGPARRTDIVDLSNGRESRNQRWRDSRRSYDVGTGVKSLADLYAVLEFFEARRGRLYGFRFRDPLDWKSGPPGKAVSALDQGLGTGDGTTAAFQLVKTYGPAGVGWSRLITRPVEGSVIVAVGGALQPAQAFSTDHARGIVSFAAGHIPSAGTSVTAGFEFDVPVRFDTDRIEVSLTYFEAGRIPAIPLVEILA